MPGWARFQHPSNAAFVSDGRGTATVKDALAASASDNLELFNKRFDVLDGVRQPHGVGGIRHLQRDCAKPAMVIVFRALFWRGSIRLASATSGLLVVAVMAAASRMTTRPGFGLDRQQVRMMEQAVRGRIDPPDA